jgi:hypothetical protein
MCRRVLVPIAVAAVASGCWPWDTYEPDVALDARPNDAADAPDSDILAPDVDAGDAAPTDTGPDCSPGSAPVRVPMVESAVVILDGDTSFPFAGGGTPRTGSWVIDRATLYLPPTEIDLVDVAGSNVTGTGWIVLDASGAYRANVNLMVNVRNYGGGLTTTPSRFYSYGTYHADDARGSSLTTMPRCGLSVSIGFTRESPCDAEFLFGHPGGSVLALHAFEAVATSCRMMDAR